jgi:hypothetical protein
MVRIGDFSGSRKNNLKNKVLEACLPDDNKT